MPPTTSGAATPSAFISTIILPAAPASFQLGTVDPTAPVDLIFSSSTPLKALRDLGVEVRTLMQFEGH